RGRRGAGGRASPDRDDPRRGRLAEVRQGDSLRLMASSGPDARPELELAAEVLAAEGVQALEDVLEHTALAAGIGARLSRQLLAFLKTEVLPQANQAAEMGVDPTPMFAMVVRVLRRYADALTRGPPTNGDHPAPPGWRSS